MNVWSEDINNDTIELRNHFDDYGQRDKYVFTEADGKTARKWSWL